MITKILTHPGGAHKDDVLAVAVLIALHSAPVVRREPTANELSDPSVAVVDIGGVHDPETMCFDHHQLPRDHPPICALSLVLQHLGLYEDALQFCDWLETAEWFDSRGPNATAKWLGVPRRAISRLNSPIDITLLRRFANTTELQPGETLYELMRFVGADLLDHLRASRARLDLVAKHSQLWSIDHAGETLQAVFLPRTDEALSSSGPSQAVASYIRSRSEFHESVAALVYPDRRGAGYGLARYEDHPRLDFSRVESEPDVHFAHTRGFMCKTTATDPERLQALIAGAWKPPVDA